MSFTHRQKFECAKRELEMRESVYRRRVVQGKMRKADADHEIACMSAIRDDYAERMASERDSSDLFRRDRPPPDNDRGFEPLGQVAGRVIDGLARELRSDIAANQQSLERLHRLEVELSSMKREAAE